MSTLSTDLIRGSKAIGEELGIAQATVLELIQTTDIPVFRIGNVNFARRSTLATWISAMELRALMRHAPPAPPPAA